MVFKKIFFEIVSVEIVTFSCIHACTNETHSVANLQDLIPTLASKFVLPIIIAAKVGIKSCRFATECVSFVHVWMQLANQLELCLHAVQLVEWVVRNFIAG